MSLAQWDELKKLVHEAEEDVAKALGGNRAAGTRARKKMQDIKAAAQEVRRRILEGRQDGDSPTGGGSSGDDEDDSAPRSPGT